MTAKESSNEKRVKTKADLISTSSSMKCSIRIRKSKKVNWFTIFNIISDLKTDIFCSIYNNWDYIDNMNSILNLQLDIYLALKIIKTNKILTILCNKQNHSKKMARAAIKARAKVWILNSQAQLLIFFWKSLTSSLPTSS